MTNKKDDAILNIFIARDAIIKKHGKERAGTGTIDCPICDDGKIKYFITKPNGNVMASCSTEDCVSWIE